MKISKLMIPVLLAVGCIAGGAEYDVLKNSEIETLRYGLGAGNFNFCSTQPEVTVVEIEQVDDGYTIEGVYQTPGETDDEGNCVEPQETGECIDTESFGPAPLDSTEVRALEELLLDIDKKQCREDRNIACDVCVIPTITVNGHTEDSFCCGDVNEGFRGAFNTVESRLKALGLAAYQAEVN